MEGMFFAAIFCATLSFLIAYCVKRGNDSDEAILSFLTFILGISFVAILNIYLGDKKPEAIEVYRGNTNLKVTYTDGVPTDSVVVFK